MGDSREGWEVAGLFIICLVLEGGVDNLEDGCRGFTWGVCFVRKVGWILFCENCFFVWWKWA